MDLFNLVGRQVLYSSCQHLDIYDASRGSTYHRATAGIYDNETFALHRVNGETWERKVQD